MQTIPSNLELSIPSTWDYTADVVVVGAGEQGPRPRSAHWSLSECCIVLGEAPAVGTTGVEAGMRVPTRTGGGGFSACNYLVVEPSAILECDWESELD